MKFVNFKEENLIMGKNQEEYLDLPVNINPLVHGTPCSMVIELTDEEMEQMKNNGNRICFTQMTFGYGFQPVSASIGLPDTISEMNEEQLQQWFIDQDNKRKQVQKNLEKAILDKMPEELKVDPKDVN